MWEQISSNCLRYLRDLLGGLFGWLFFLAFLAGVIEEGSFECFGDEVFGRVAGLNEFFFGIGFGVVWLEDGYVIRAFDSK